MSKKRVGQLLLVAGVLGTAVFVWWFYVSKKHSVTIDGQLFNYRVSIGGGAGEYEVHAFDKKGRHTGTVVLDEGAVLFEEKIPNSSFERYGGAYYITLDPFEAKYKIEVKARDVTAVVIRVQLLDYDGDRLGEYTFEPIFLSQGAVAVLDLEQPSKMLDVIVDAGGNEREDGRYTAPLLRQ